MNYDEQQLTEGGLSCSFYLYSLFRKYVSYGFPIINFCNPGVHYETPCTIYKYLVVLHILIILHIIHRRTELHMRPHIANH
jgi:hypothetical protein